MKTVCEKRQSNGWVTCIEKCPQKCISVEDSISEYNAVIDTDKCENCKLCEKVCPNIIAVKKSPPFIGGKGRSKSEFYIRWRGISLNKGVD